MGGSLLRMLIRVVLRKHPPKPSPAYGSRFKNDDRQEGARRRATRLHAWSLTWGSRCTLSALSGHATGAGRESPRCCVSSASTGTQHHVSCLKRKSAFACMEQKFRCLRLARIIHKNRGDAKCAHSYSAACSLRRCLFPHLHKPVIRLLRRRLLSSLPPQHLQRSK